MLISHARKFVFVHVPRTAGTSIANALVPYTYPMAGQLICRWLRYRGGDPAIQHYSQLEGLHAHSLAWEIRDQIGPAYDEYFSFAFVRNPWDYHVSFYEYAMQQPDNEWHTRVKEAGSFDRYIDQVAKYIGSQSEYVCDRLGKCIVRYIGRYERLQAGMAYICRRIGVTVRLPRLNQSKRKNYRDYYTPQAAECIARYHAEDIARFGYRF